MRRFTRGSISIARRSLRAHKGRSLLTMLGIIIGVSSVITVVCIGQGVKTQIAKQINTSGKNLITVRPGRVATSSLGGLQLFTSVQTGSSLTQHDVATVAKTPGVGTSVPLSVINGTAHTERGDFGGVVIATNSKFASILNQGMAYGAFYTDDDSDSNAIVLGAHAAQAMFTEDVPLGQTVSFRGQDFIVRGILNPFVGPPLSADIDFNNAVFIPLGAANQLTNFNTSPYEILVKPSATTTAATVSQNLEHSLLKLHGDSHDFTVLKQSDNLASTAKVLDLLTELVAGVAAISLLVGGVGIMNVMLVSVTERMHEVGIRKAVGATNRQILDEFIAEAVVLSVTGVLIGVVISLIINVLLRIFTSLTPSFDWPIFVIAAIVSIAIGVLFGTAPALKAARKDPIAALRNEW